MPSPIVLLAPAPGMTFVAMPSGSTYVSDANALVVVTNASVADELALIAAGCLPLEPVSVPTSLTIVANTISLKSFPSASFANDQQFRAINNVNDGPGNDYYWDNSAGSSGAADNGGSVLRSADRPTGPGILRILPKPFYSSSDFGCNGDGVTDVFSNLQNGVVAAWSDGKGLFQLDPGVHAVGRSDGPLVLPHGMTYRGMRGQSVIKAVGSTFLSSLPAFPAVSGAMINTGNPLTGGRYLAETGRVASVSGCTFNLTLSSNQVTAATVVAGGTGAKLGDSILIIVGTANCVLTVSGVTGYKGSVAGVTVKSSTNNWTSVTNPVAMTSSTGQAVWDRILDPMTLGADVNFDGITLDGNWGGNAAGSNAVLTGGQRYVGLDIRGHGFAKVTHSTFQNFPNDGLTFFDVRRQVCSENIFYNNGWTGVQGTTRNGSSHWGIYVTTNASQLNSDQSLVANNLYLCNNDVGINHQFFTGIIANNHILDFGGIGIEGQGGSQGTMISNIDASGESILNNGGVTIPSDVHYAGNVVDGTRSISASWAAYVLNGTGTTQSNFPFGFDGISDTAGNQGKKTFVGNVVKNTVRRALYATQGLNGDIVVDSNRFYYVGRGAAHPFTVNPVFELQGWRVAFTRNKVQGYLEYGSGDVDNSISGGAIIVLPGFGSCGKQLDISDNEFDFLQFVSLVVKADFGSFSGQYFRYNRNKVSNCWGSRMLDWSEAGGANSSHYQVVEICENTLINIQDNPSSSFTDPNFQIYTDNSTSRVDVDLFRFDGNTYTSNSPSRLNVTTPILWLNAKSVAAWPQVSISRNLTSGFALYAFGANQSAPTNVYNDNNH
jgi:hypothetical protein